MAKTLAELRLASRRRADMENSTFIKDDELDLYINNSYGELYDLLVSRFEDYFIKSPVPEFIVTSGNTIDLPSDFYKMRGLDLSLNGSWIDVSTFNFTDRNSGSKIINNLNGRHNRAYRILGQSIHILPEDNASGTYRMWYVPRVTPLVADSDEMADVLDFEDYVIVDAAIKMLTKEESDVTALMMVKEGLRKRIQNMSANRDAGSPQRIQDVRGHNSIDGF